ncbi:MAG: Gfo/Idh/MocA family oxidoreductase [Gemmataceae bacterium]
MTTQAKVGASARRDFPNPHRADAPTLATLPRDVLPAGLGHCCRVHCQEPDDFSLRPGFPPMMDHRDFLTASGCHDGCVLRRPPDPRRRRRPLRVGLIGTGWYGKCDLFRLIQVAPVEIVSLCDVDQHMLANAAEMVSQRPKSKRSRVAGNYKKMLAEKDLDVCFVHTPDHWHALPMIAAVESGAHVYVQKPISVDVMEGKAMLDAARKHKKVVQVGTQRRGHLIDARDKANPLVCLVPSATPKSTAITTCGAAAHHRYRRCRITSTTKCG